MSTRVLSSGEKKKPKPSKKRNAPERNDSNADAPPRQQRTQVHSQVRVDSKISPGEKQRPRGGYLIVRPITTVTKTHAKCTTSILDQVLKTVTPFLSFPAPKRIGRMDKRLKNVSGYVSLSLQ